MSSVGLPNNACSPSRTPSGSPRIDVTIWNRSFFTWARSVSDSAPVGTAWLPVTTADKRLTPIAQNSRVQRIEIPGSTRPVQKDRPYVPVQKDRPYVPVQKDRPYLLSRRERHRCADELIAAGTGLRAELLRATDV